MAYTSSRPKTSYNINVLRLSALEEYKHKTFGIGDISFIEDVEFFGYQVVDGLVTTTPYKEKCLYQKLLLILIHRRGYSTNTKLQDYLKICFSVLLPQHSRYSIVAENSRAANILMMMVLLIKKLYRIAWPLIEIWFIALKMKVFYRIIRD